MISLAQRYYVEQWDVESLTGRLDKHGNIEVYKVSLAEDGHYECSCGAWKYQRFRRGDCKHILFIRDNHPSVASVVQNGEARRPTVIQNNEFKAELMLNGRLKAFKDSL